MPEQITLAVAEMTPAIITTDYRVVGLTLDFEHAMLTIRIRGTNGEPKEFRYEGATATTLMIALNKANLSLKSLQRRVLERLLADGLIAGAVTGNPD